MTTQDQKQPETVNPAKPIAASWRCRPVLQASTGQVFPSATAAAEALGTSQAWVSASIRGGYRCRGEVLSYVDRAQPAQDVTHEPRVDGRSLRSLPFQDEAGRVFKTLAEGAKFYGTSEQTVWSALNVTGGWKGHVFAYLTVSRDLPSRTATPTSLCRAAAELAETRVTVADLEGVLRYNPTVRAAVRAALGKGR